jgi:probable rRNA maturation factor
MNTKTPVINFILLDHRWATYLPSWNKEVTQALEKATKALEKDLSTVELSVVLASSHEVQNLNKSFRHKDKATNVLSFPSAEESELGDIILAYDVIQKEAEKEEISLLDHTLHLIIHGFLHLLGYDHESDDEAYIMESMEIRILKDLNIANPYEDL